MQERNRPIVNGFLGFMAVVLGHIIAVVIMWILSIAPVFNSGLGILLIYAFFGIGFTQLIYVVPLCLWLRSKGRSDTLKGVLIAALITLLLNGGCFIFVMSGGWI